MKTGTISLIIDVTPRDLRDVPILCSKKTLDEFNRLSGKTLKKKKDVKR